MVAYVLNKHPTSSLEDIILYEAWIGWKPMVKYFKVLGCLAYVHVSPLKK